MTEMTNKDSSIRFNTYENIENNGRSFSEDKNGSDGFLSAADVLENKKGVERFTTGSSQLDEILGGGIEVGSITQFYGAPGSGKSQICLTVCALLPKQYRSIYIDTEHKLRPIRIQQILENRGLQSNNVLNNILITKPFNTQQMERSIDQIPTFFDSNRSIKLIVVDLIINLLRIEYSGRSQLPARQQKLNLIMSKLHNLAIEKNIAIIITNHIQTDPNSFSPSLYTQIPTGGNILEYGCTHIIALKKTSIDNRATLVKSNYLPCDEGAYFIITEKGIENGRKNIKK
jgi:DNA repair protein RadA